MEDIKKENVYDEELNSASDSVENTVPEESGISDMEEKNILNEEVKKNSVPAENSIPEENTSAADDVTETVNDSSPVEDAAVPEQLYIENENSESADDYKTGHYSGQRYSYNPNGNEDEPSFKAGGQDTAYSGGHQQNSGSYEKPADSSYRSYGQPTWSDSGRNPSYGTYGQSSGNTSQRTSYGSYGQSSGNMPQGTSYGQPTGGTPNGRYGQPAGGNVPNNSYGQLGGNTPQSGSPDRNGRYSNDGYGTGRTGYSSNYDSYRFETPVDPAPINSGDTQFKKKKSDKSKEDFEKKGNGKNSTLKKAGLITGIAVLFGLVAALVFLGVTSLAGRKVTESGQNNGNEITAIPTPEVILGNQDTESETESAQKSTGTYDTAVETPELTVPQVVEQCMPSMVSITNTTIEEYQDFFGGTSQQESVSAGSGIIVGETETELLIATNNHVIENSRDITVTFIDEAAITGTIKGMDADNDLAIVAVKLEDISQETKDAIRIITIGDSDALVVGESVVAIGNALGYGQSVSAGIVSAIGREVDIEGQSHALIQTDASINPGNSGGALINMRGELIGINEVKYVDETVEGVGYAIPMSTAEPILDSLGSKAARQKVDDDQASYIGIKCIDVPSYYVQAGYPSGVYVSEATEGGPAEAAGLKEGDIITAIDGISVSSSSQLINYLQYYAAGEVIDFSISRLNEDNTAFESTKIPITLGSKKDSELFNEESADEDEFEEEVPSEEDDNEGGLGGFPFLPDVENR